MATSLNCANASKSAITALLLSFAGNLVMAANAIAESNVSINGYRLNTSELINLERSLGTTIPSGNYVLNTYTGCWVNLSTGANGCPASTYVGRYGSGEQNAAGDWSYYSNTSGFGVGGTGDGCLYAGDWSNC